MSQYFKGKRILVTGHEGFLGSNLTRRLISYGANVIGLDRVVLRKNTILTKADLKKIKVIKGNVANHKLIKEIITKYKIEFIFHLAAEAIVDKCLKNPMDAFSSNIKGTWNILESVRQNPVVKGIIIASSDKAYGIKNVLPYNETDSLEGSHPYDVSKSCADLLSYTYFKTYGLPVCVTRCGNIYGPGDFNFSRIVPGTIRSVLMGKKLLIRSNGSFTRDYIYVEDTVNAYLLLAENIVRKKLNGEAFNFSNENPSSVINLVRRVYKIAKELENYKILDKAKYEIPHQYLSAKKARKVLKWKPDYNLNNGLETTIKWYKRYFR